MTKAIIAALVLAAAGCNAQVSVNPLPGSSMDPGASAAPTTMPSAAPTASATPGQGTSSAVIRDSGSTNTFGYTILVQSDGSATFSSGNGLGNGHVDAALAQKLFADIAAAQPLSALQSGQCAKSASFGTSTTLMFGSDTSPDLQCAGEAKGAAVYSDVKGVASALNVQNVPRSSGSTPPDLPGT